MIVPNPFNVNWVAPPLAGSTRNVVNPTRRVIVPTCSSIAAVGEPINCNVPPEKLRVRPLAVESMKNLPPNRLFFAAAVLSKINDPPVPTSVTFEANVASAPANRIAPPITRNVTGSAELFAVNVCVPVPVLVRKIRYWETSAVVEISKMLIGPSKVASRLSNPMVSKPKA